MLDEQDWNNLTNKVMALFDKIKALEAENLELKKELLKGDT